MEDRTREALIALRDVKDPDEFVEKITPALEGSYEVELAYMLGRIDQASVNYFHTSSVKATLRTIIAQSFIVPTTPKSADDYKSPEDLAADLAADA